MYQECSFISYFVLLWSSYGEINHSCTMCNVHCTMHIAHCGSGYWFSMFQFDSWQHKIFFRFWIRRLSLEASSVTSDIVLLTYLQKRKNILQHMNKWKWNMWNYSYNYFPFTIIVLALWWCNGGKYPGYLCANYAMAVWDFLLDFKVSKTTNDP